MTSTIKVVSQQPTSQSSASVSISTVIFALLSISSLVLSILVFFDFINLNENTEEDGYCPSDECEINANDFTGAIISTSKIQNVSSLTVNSDYITSLISSTNMSITEGTFSIFKSPNITFKEGFTVENGTSTFINSQKNNITNLSISNITCNNISFTNFTCSNLVTNNLFFNNITSSIYNFINGSFSNFSVTNIKSSINLNAADFICANLNYLEISPNITNITTSVLLATNLIIKGNSTISNLYTNLKLTINELNFNSSTQPIINLKSITGKSIVCSGTGNTTSAKNITSTTCQGISNDLSQPFKIPAFLYCQNATIKNMTITNISVSNLQANNITCTNITITSNMIGQIKTYPDRVQAQKIVCDNYINYKYENENINTSKILYENIIIKNIFNNSLKKYSASTYNSDGKINLFDIDIKLIENKIDSSKYRSLNTININGDYPSTNDININVSFTNVNQNSSFNASKLLGTSFELNINKNILNPSQNNVYLKINNLLPISLRFFNLNELGTLEVIETGKSPKFTLKSQENIVTVYKFYCIETKNNSITYFISIK